MIMCERTTAQVSELDESWTPPTSILVHRQINHHSDIVSWSCACRVLESAGHRVQPCDSSDPEVRDPALVRVEDVGHRSSIMNVHNKTMRVYPGDVLQEVLGNRTATDAMEANAADTGESVEARATEYESRSLPGSLFRAIGFGLGIAGLCVTASTLILAPVLVVEPNEWIRDLELFWIGVGLVALVAQLFVTKR